MSFFSLGLVTLLLVQAAPRKGDPIRPPAPAGLSWEDADWVSETVARVERRLSAGKPASRQTIVVTERQLNSWVNLSLAGKIPEGMSGFELGLQKDRLLARGLLDLDRVKSKVPQGVGTGLLAFLSGSVPVELRGRFSSAEGTGKVEVEEALVAGISLPPALRGPDREPVDAHRQAASGLRHPVSVPAALHRSAGPSRARAGARRFLPVGPRRAVRRGKITRGTWTSRRRSSS